MDEDKRTDGLDTAAFLSERFDVQDYAEAVLQGRPYRPDDEPVQDKGKARATDGQGNRGDVGVELARLNQGIVSKFQRLSLLAADGPRKM
jgi:hypothetical protein